MRPRPPPRPVDTEAERKILNLIKSKTNLGICTRDIFIETKLHAAVITRSLKSLLTGKKLIKQVVNIQIQNNRNKHYMAVEFEPSKEITGGVWYDENGKLNKALLDELQKLCLRYIMHKKKVITLEEVHILVMKVVTFKISSEEVEELLNLMVLNNFIIEVKSTGLGDYFSIPIGKICYRVARADVSTGPVMNGVFAPIPCSACERTSLCASSGDIRSINPSTCVYYDKWLNIDF